MGKYNNFIEKVIKDVKKLENDRKEMLRNFEKIREKIMEQTKDMPEMTLEEINAEIYAARQERKRRQEINEK